MTAILLDLDGTLLDTLDDITVALNRALAEQQLAALTSVQVRDLIGRGVPTLITRAVARLGVAMDPAGQATLRKRFCFHYGRLHMLDECHACVYPGVAEAARAAGLPVVCVPYGYNEGSDPRALSCDAFIETLSDFPAFLLSASPAVNSFSQPA